MVPRNRFDTAPTDDLQAFVRIGVVANEVAQRDDLIDPLSVNRLEHGSERLEICMNVGDDRVSHLDSRLPTLAERAFE